MNKPQIMFQWMDAKQPTAMARQDAAKMLWWNRKAGRIVYRKMGETHIRHNGVSCRIFKAV